MDLRDETGTAARFCAYAADLASVLGHADRVRPFEDYCVGLLSAEGRKSVEPLAAVTAPERTAAQHQSLLHLVAQAPWSDHEIADRNYVVSAAADAKLCKDLFGAYRRRRAQHGDNHPGLDRFSYLGLLAVGETEEIGLQRLSKVRGWVWSSGVTPPPPPQFANPPEFNPATVSAPMLRRDPAASWATRAAERSGRTINPSTCPPQDLVDLGMGFGGTPDQVYDQLVDLYHHVGGFGHLLAMMQGGDLSHAETADSMRLFAKEVMPRLRELPPPAPEYARDWTRAA